MVVDSNRRDITVNAMSCDFNGNLYDYHNGLKDLKGGRIKFIGDSKKRIKEDFLRILRYFRFYAYYGKNNIEKNQINTFKNLSSNLKKLSSERLYYEFEKILLSNNAYKVIKLMQNSGVLKYIIFNKNYIERIKSLNKFNKINHLIDFSTRLAIILNKKNLLKVSRNLKLSKAENYKINKLMQQNKSFNFKDFEKNKSKYVYYYGHEMLQSLLIYNFFKGTSNSKVQKYLRIIYSVKNLKIPNFQIFGKDIIRLGIKPGPKIGKLIKLIESWWILNNFKPSKKECLKKLEELI